MRLESAAPSPSRRAFAERKRRPLAFAAELAARQAADERVGLLLVSVDDWEGGADLLWRPGVARVVVPEDLPTDRADWSCVAGLDVLVCGAAAAERFDAAVLATMQAGAASVWGEMADGVWRLEFWPHRSPYYAGANWPERGLPVAKLGAALARHRRTAILFAEGFYGSAAFEGVRADMLMGNG